MLNVQLKLLLVEELAVNLDYVLITTVPLR